MYYVVFLNLFLMYIYYVGQLTFNITTSFTYIICLLRLASSLPCGRLVLFS